MEFDRMVFTSLSAKLVVKVEQSQPAFGKRGWSGFQALPGLFAEAAKGLKGNRWPAGCKLQTARLKNLF